MKDISEVTCCVVDTGLFLNFARTMATKCKRVLYHNPDLRSYPSIHQACIGDGFPELEVIRDLWSFVGDIDVFCYPDVGRGAEQSYLRSIGKPVWGSGWGQSLELKRESFLTILDTVGLDVPKYSVCIGVDELRAHLEDKEDQYVKISRYRFDMETHHWRNLAMDEGWLDSLKIRFGPLKNKVRFIVLPSIDADIEIGGDTYNVDGKWPSLMLNGVEGKDKSYFAAVTQRNEMPEQVQAVMEAFSPVLKTFSFRSQWSSEIRVAGDKFYFIDPTCRGGMPSSGSQQLLWENFPEIVYAGAHGILLDPEPAAKFSIETMITAKDEDCEWTTLELDPALEGFAQFNGCCYVDGVYAFPKREYGGHDLGWLVSIGNSPKEVLEKQKEAADLLPDGFNADVEALASVIQDIDKAAKDGVVFSQQAMPDPASVL